MGAVIELAAWRRGRAGTPEPSDELKRLELAVARLDAIVRRLRGRVRGPTRIETELLAITGTVSRGRVDEAARKAERLADRLEHPASRVDP